MDNTNSKDNLNDPVHKSEQQKHDAYDKHPSEDSLIIPPDVKSMNRISSSSYEDCKNRFDTTAAAEDYAKKHISSRKHKQEMRCIEAALSGLARGSSILDIPCGTGRLSHFLHKLGFNVVGADYSHYMIKIAKLKLIDVPIGFEQQDVLAIKHANNKFDAVLCNRLFHHFPTSELRRVALKELARVCKGPLIVSFFNSYSLSAQWRKLKKIFQTKRSLDRLPISYHAFKRDVEACGLTIENTYYCARGLSPQTYVRLIKT